MTFRTTALIAAGGNLDSPQGTPAQTVLKGLKLLAQQGVRVRAVSRFYQTPSFPAGAGPDYVNAAFFVETDLPVGRFLPLLHQVEAHFARERTQRWGQRTLDLDLISFGDLVHPDLETFGLWRDLPLAEQARRTPDQLILPHPRVQDRGFVLVPLMDIAPDWRHPVLGLTVRQMHARLPAGELATIVPL